MKTWREIEFSSVLPIKNNRIIGMSFPRNDKNLGLEPSIINVLPDGAEYDEKNLDYNSNEVKCYMCSVYISGLEEFNSWKSRHDKSKIIVGGYHPTTFPEDFEDIGKVVTGPCDNIWKTIEQEGRIVQGIVDYSRNPRRDLYDIKNNQQIIPDKNIDDSVMSISTSMGCPQRPPCDFCCTPMMCPKLESRPLESLERELKEMVRIEKDLKFLFIRDENFTAQRDWRERLEIINNYFPKTKIYLFGSANTLRDIKTLKENGVYMICLGLEDPTETYAKNKNLDEKIKELKENGIYTYLSFIVDPLKIVGREQGREFYEILLKRLIELMPEMVCGNFLMPFRGTKLWDKYYHLIDYKDYKFYNSKEPFLIRNSVVREKMKFFMFWYQWLYYNSDEYAKIRKFDCLDTLHLRFIELFKEFEPKYRRIWDVRP